ncbi:hypothetical protein [Spirilliplanes yamanashiensis]|uniref:Uncharacterized protein n=1 Tax=Spirilliplanes yamanashiensis TaxID=42233 RepID=A0A8J4DG30_9ACTN|nr:hypothetical protein [Spirilliplanes yamanashiensis]MDP9814123.1 hypothetical protein [Spirilliplanes yamanashiensis]GIJ00896.1 hypothetical protein Sya03_02480 [Spirilliplanes yamanashiensis]
MPDISVALIGASTVQTATLRRRLEQAGYVCRRPDALVVELRDVSDCSKVGGVIAESLRDGDPAVMLHLDGPGAETTHFRIQSLTGEMIGSSLATCAWFQ